MRLDKYLAEAECGTRSQLGKIIRSGRVSVNGEVVNKSDMHIDENADLICLDGAEIRLLGDRYFLLNKPAGILSASRDSRKETVVDLIPEHLRKDLFPVGRLDIDTTGLLLLTNDGKLSHDLLSPRHHVDKTYVAGITGTLDEEKISAFENGLDIGDVKKNGSPDLTLPAKLRVLEDEKYAQDGLTMTEVSIHEGRFHQIKRMFEAIGCTVVTLERIAMGPLRLEESLARGEWRELSDQEISELKNRNKE